MSRRRTGAHRRRKTRGKTIVLIGAALLVVVIAIGAVASRTSEPVTNLDSAAIAQRLAASGLPMGDVVTYDAETDPNGLLGRPKGYTSKSSFADTRIAQHDAASPEGGTIEVFASRADAKKRHDYINAFSGTVMGTYQYLYGNVLMRISYELTQSQADEYGAALTEALAGGGS